MKKKKGIFWLMLLVSISIFLFFVLAGIDPLEPFERGKYFLVYLAGFLFVMSGMGIVLG